MLCALNDEGSWKPVPKINECMYMIVQESLKLCKSVPSAVHLLYESCLSLIIQLQAWAWAWAGAQGSWYAHRTSIAHRTSNAQTESRSVCVTDMALESPMAALCLPAESCENFHLQGRCGVSPPSRRSTFALPSRGPGPLARGRGGGAAQVIPQRQTGPA